MVTELKNKCLRTAVVPMSTSEVLDKLLAKGLFYLRMHALAARRYSPGKNGSGTAQTGMSIRRVVTALGGQHPMETLAGGGGGNATCAGGKDIGHKIAHKQQRWGPCTNHMYGREFTGALPQPRKWF